MLKQFLDDIIKNQTDPKFDDCRYNGRLNVAECLVNMGLTMGDRYSYVVTHYTFPEADYSQLDMYDFAFNWCDYSAAKFKGIKFDGCRFDRAPIDMSYVHLLNMDLGHNSFQDVQCIGARLTNCTHSDELYLVNFTNALIESDGASLGNFFSGQGGVASCSFNGATIKDQLITDGIRDCWLEGATIENSVLLNARISCNIVNTHFNNVTVVPPYGHPAYIWSEKHSLLDLKMFKNNTITNSRWQYLTLYGINPVANRPQEFSGNSFINNTFSCTTLLFDQNSYEGVQIKKIMEASRNGALMKNNDFKPERWGGFPCVDRSRSATIIKVGITAMWVAIPLFVVLSVTILITQVYSRYIVPKRHRQFLSDFRDLVDHSQYLKRDLKNLKNYQSGMMKIVRNSLFLMHEKAYTHFPQELFEMVLNYFPLMNLENPNLAYREELAMQRSNLSLTFFKPLDQEIEDDTRIDIGENDDEDIPLVDFDSFEYQIDEFRL